MRLAPIFSHLLIPAALVSLVILLSGCSSFNRLALKAGYQQISEARQQISQLESKHAAELSDARAKVDSKMSELLAQIDAQNQAVGNALYGADMTFQTLPSPTRPELIINNFVNEGWAAIGRKMPDYPTMVKINERIKRELDETRTSMEELKKSHDEAMKSNAKLSDDTREKQAQLEKAQADIKSLNASHLAEINKKLAELSAAQDKVVALEQERADNKEAVERTKFKMISVVGVLALLCVAGAIWSPVYKSKFAIGAAVFGFIAIGINFIQPIHLVIGGGLILALLIGYAVLEHNKERRAAGNVYAAIQSIKENSKEAYDQYVKPQLTEWNTKYLSDGSKVPDKAAQDLIDKRLMEKELK